MSEDRGPDMLEEIDDPSELLSRPLEPVPLVRTPSPSSPNSVEKKRVLPPGFSSSSTGASTSSGTSSRIWTPGPRSVPVASSSGSSGGYGMIIEGSGARVPTQFLDQSGSFTRPGPSTSVQQAVNPSAAVRPPSMPGAFPLSSSAGPSSQAQPQRQQSMQQARAIVDLTLDSDDDEKPATHRAPITSYDPTASSAGPSGITLPQGNGSRSRADQTVSVVDDDEDEDEPVIVSHKLASPKAEDFEIDHVKSNAIICAGMINAVVLCMQGLPPSLTYNGVIGQDPPADPNFSRESWPRASRFWIEDGYRPLMLHLTNPTNLSASNRALPGGWTFTAPPPQRADINVSVVVPPRARFPQLSVEEANQYGPAAEQSFGSLADKYKDSMEPLLRQNKMRCEARCRMVPIGRAQNFLHYLEILVFARRTDLALVSDRLSSHGIQLEHPTSYHPEDYPTEPQYENPHNPPAGGMRNDAMLGMYNGIHRGAGMGTIIQNRELSEKEKKAQVDAVYASLRSGEELPAIEPAEVIATPLLEHQKQALSFLINREKDRRWPELLLEPAIDVDVSEVPADSVEGVKPESAKDEKSGPVKAETSASNSTGKHVNGKGKSKSGKEEEADEDSISLWKVRKGLNGKVRAWRNLITNRETFTQPRICRGAILADDMGLGKTISTLALIAHTRRDARLFGAMKVERDPQVELDQAMRLANISTEVASREAERRNGVGKVNSRSKRQLSESDDDFEDDDVKPDEDDDDKLTMSLAVHGAPPAAATASAKSRGKKPQKDKIDPEVARRQNLECRSRATLIVCPLSVVSNWEEQIREHWSRKKRPKIYVYHGPSRSTSIRWIADHDIVLTTYSTLGSEFSNQSTWVTEGENKKRNGKKDGSPDSDAGRDDDDDDDEIFMVNQNGIPIETEASVAGAQRKGKKPKRKPGKEALNPLQRIDWFRIVLDEAHQIKGAGTWQSRATCNLTAQRRICLTGTPIQNTINDLYALVKFLRLEPFTDRAVWNEFCGHRENLHLRVKKEDGPIDSANIGHVQILMKFLALRRQKTTKTADGKALLTLPPKLSKTEYLDFEEREKARYQALHDKYKDDFEGMMANDTVKHNYATILHEILNLRMTCDHPSMVDASKDAKRMGRGADLSEAIKQDGLSPERAAVLFILFRDSEMAYCSECQADLSSSVEADAGGNDAQELADALDDAAADSRNGNGSRKRTKIEPGTGAMSAGTSSNGIGTPAGGGAVRPVVTRCQHIFCSACFRRTIGHPWPDVTSEDIGHCPACNDSLQLALDAVELDASDFVGLNDDQAERMADGDSDFIDDEVADERRSKQLKGEDSDKDELVDDFDWGSGDEDQKSQVSRPKAPRKNGREVGSSSSRPPVPLDGRKDLSTKIRALIADLLPFSKCNPHSSLFDPLAPRLVHIDPSTSEDAEVRKVEEPVVVIQRPPPAVTSSGLLGKLDQSFDVIDSYDPVKSVVFSQWTKMLDRIQKSLSITGIRYTRLDGTMRRPDRTAALEAFKRDPSIEVLLVSLRAGGTGLNLVTACRAYLMDPYWNPAVENQGLDRVHRMGQTKPVITTKYIMRHSIEENMLRLQKRKLMIAEKVGSKRQIGAMGAEARREERNEELRILFGTSSGGVEL
ncbi:putative DNA repair protein RAD16 (putative) [Pseudozyma hubeiensis]|nr:putative DNA repair protein RAD16 (putative) [Pseudozyma hubeiensis]